MRKTFDSKKKKRNYEFQQRELKRQKDKKRNNEFDRIFHDPNSTIEDLAKYMGVKLQ